MDLEAVAMLNGHCVDHDQPDQYHHLCPGRWRTGFGAPRVCSCPNHDLEENDDV